jgi:hypothetical protein
MGVCESFKLIRVLPDFGVFSYFGEAPRWKREKRAATKMLR